MNRTCLFCEIAAGDRTAEIVLEDEQTLAFLDHRPLFPGHCLLIPRSHYDTLLDLPDALSPELVANTRRLARALETAVDAKGSLVAINNRVSQSVPHLHVHVVPRRPKDGLKGFFWPRHPYRDAEHAAATAGAIRDALSGP